MPPEIAPLLRCLPHRVSAFTPAALADYFELPPRHFHQRATSAPVQFHQAGLTGSMAYALRGTLFWPSDKRIVRGYPRIRATSDYVADPAAVALESAMYEALKTLEAAIEVKQTGVTMRLYHRAGGVHFATDASFDGSNPLTAAGIQNARVLGIDYASQARRLFEGDYRRAAALARLGYVPVFELLLPERESVVPAERPDLLLIDVIDPDHGFVDRLEKERIAEDYGLHVSTLHGRLQQASTPSEFYSRLRGLEHVAARGDIAGFMVKAPCNHDQLAVEIEPPTIRQAWTVIDETDMKAVYDAILTDFVAAKHAPAAGKLAGLPSPIDDPAFLTEMMLDYLDNHNRSVRWQVMQWLAAI